MPFVYLFLACVFCYSCSFLFVVLYVCVFRLLSLELCRCSSDLFLSSRPRTYRIGNHVHYWVSSSTPLYCLRENISFDTLIRRSSRGHNSRKATQPSHCGTCLILLIFIAKRVQPSLPSSTLRSNFVYPRQISRSPRVGHCMS